MLVWTSETPDRGWLRTMGYAVLPYNTLCSAFVAPARAVGVRRTSLASPVQPLLDRYAHHTGVAVLDARLDTLEDLRILYGFVLEPAHRAGCRLVVHAPGGSTSSTRVTVSTPTSSTRGHWSGRARWQRG